MAPNTGKLSNNKQISAHSNPTIKKATRKQITTSLPYSPTKPTNSKPNKVFVVGCPLGIILLHTEKAFSKDDAFTFTVNKKLENSEDNLSNILKIQKICNRHLSPHENNSLLQSTTYPSKWFVSITEEDKNTPEYRSELAQNFIAFLNNFEWRFPQTFTFAGDQTIENNKLDMYLLNDDIATILGKYIFEDFNDFLNNEEAIANVFTINPTSDHAKHVLKYGWNKVSNVS
jgi:hypothetical protein